MRLIDTRKSPLTDSFREAQNRKTFPAAALTAVLVCSVAISQTTEDVRVKVYKDAAVVTGLAKWGLKYKGQEINQERGILTCM